MPTNFDRHFFSQIGLDSGALTMLGAVVHGFGEPGAYRGIARRGAEPEATFYITVDKASPVAQVNIDLAALVEPQKPGTCGCGTREGPFVVNPRGYAVFRVSGGAGGFSVHVQRAVDEANPKIFDSRELQDGDIFSAIIIRPGTYSVENLLTKAKAELKVAYPKLGTTAYRPPGPLTAECARHSIDPAKLDLQPGQGVNFHAKAPSRIKIELVKADDGPGRHEPARSGWKKPTLPRR
jgi:hypothetical protein